MENTAGVRHYFIEAFTPFGTISLLSELLKEIKNTYLLTGGPGSGKSTMMKLIGIQLIDRGYEVDYIRSIREPDSVAGLILPKHKVCMIDKNEFLSESKFNWGTHRNIDFNGFYRKTRIEEHRNRINELEKKLVEIEQKIISQLGKDYKKEKNIVNKIKHKEIPSIEEILSLSDFIATNNKEKDTPELEEITVILSKIRKNSIAYYFLHGLQIEGWLNLAPRYLKDYDRICLEGVDSTKMIREILQEVWCLGQLIEIIVHPLKPYTIVGIVFPEKNLAVWKGNPCRIEEQGFIKNHSLEMAGVLEEYKTTRLELKNLINDTVVFQKLDHLRSELLSSILADIREG